MGKCNECNPCIEEQCLGCKHYHTTECITLEDAFGIKPLGTNLTDTLAYIWTLLQDSGEDGVDGVGIQSATVNGSGHLIITLTNSVIIDAGLVKGTNGTNGTNGVNGTNGTNGTNGADNISLLYKNLTDYSTATTGSWVTSDSYTLPSATVTNDDIIEIDLVLSNESYLDDKFNSLFRLSFSTGEVLENQNPLTAHNELLAMRRTVSIDRVAYYNLNIKIYVNGTTPEYNISFINNINTSISALPSSGFIKDNSSNSNCNFTLGTTFNFQLFNNVANTAKIHSIIIKHIKN
jgi:hypothetical protein